MVIAGLAAQGTTEISCIHHIERGYEDIVRKLSGVGADIRVVVTPRRGQADAGGITLQKSFKKFSGLSKSLFDRLGGGGGGAGPPFLCDHLT